MSNRLVTEDVIGGDVVKQQSEAVAICKSYDEIKRQMDEIKVALGRKNILYRH